MQEIFRDIKGYEGHYQVSDYGRVKSLKRIDGNNHPIKERMLKPAMNCHGYLTVSIHNGTPKTYSIHQLVAVAFLNHKPCGHKVVVDHKDFDRTNNHLSNLRLISTRENSNKNHLKSSSIYTGVCWHKTRKKWQAEITVNNKQKHLGRFTNEIDASRAYQIALLQTLLSNNLS